LIFTSPQKKAAVRGKKPQSQDGEQNNRSHAGEAKTEKQKRRCEIQTNTNVKKQRHKFYKKQGEHHRNIWSRTQKVNKNLNLENTKEPHHVLNTI